MAKKSVKKEMFEGRTPEEVDAIRLADKIHSVSCKLCIAGLSEECPYFNYNWDKPDDVKKEYYNIAVEMLKMVDYNNLNKIFKLIG